MSSAGQAEAPSPGRAQGGNAVRREIEVPEDFITAPSFDKLHAALLSGVNAADARVAAAAQIVIRQDEEVMSETRSQYSRSVQDIVPVGSGTMAEQLSHMQKQIEDLRRSAQDSNRETATIKGFMRQLFEKLDQSITQVRMDQENYIKKRDLIDQQVVARVGDASYNPVALKEYMQQAAEEMKNGWDAMLDHHRKVKLCLERESRERLQASDDLEKHLMTLLHKEQHDRDMHNSKFHAYLSSVQNDVEQQREQLHELPVLRKKVMMLEEKIDGLARAQLAELDQRFIDPIRRIKDLELRNDHLQALLNQETAARHSMAEMFEQLMKQERSKVVTLINQKAAVARSDVEELSKMLVDRIEKEHAEREAHLEDFQQVYTRYKAAVHDRISTNENDLRALEQKYQVVLKELRDLETGHRRLEDFSQSTLRDAKRELTMAIMDEKTSREEAQRDIHEQLTWLGETQDKMRELAVQRGPRKMIALTSKSPSSAEKGSTWALMEA